MAAEEEGGTVLEHLQAMERQTGVTPQMLLDAPPLPAGCEELWRIFSELHSCRGEGLNGSQRITYADIHAFEQVNGLKLRAWELDAIRRADAAYLQMKRPTRDGD